MALSKRILLRTNPMLGALCAAAGGVLVRNRRLSGTTIVTALISGLNIEVSC